MSKTSSCALSVLMLAIVLVIIPPDASAIVNGQPDQNAHPYVGMVRFHWTGVTFNLGCGATLISPTVVITAAHCLFLFGQPISAEVSFDFQITGSSKWIQATAWYAHPDFCIFCGSGTPQTDTHDVAVVILQSPITSQGYGVLPAEGLIDTLANHAVITMVGYGATAVLPPQTYQFEQTRYSGSLQLIRNEGVLSDEFVTFTSNLGNDKSGTCVADSGSPALLGNTNTILAVEVLNSPHCTGVERSYGLDSASALNFINSFLD